jgi:hypothetical protein
MTMIRFILLTVVLFVTQTLDAQCLEGDCENGRGKFQYRDGSVYEGQFKDRMASGYGVCHYANGNVYSGEWLRHTFNGEGVLTYSNGGVVKAGIWQQGKLVERISPKDAYFSTPTRSLKSQSETDADEHEIPLRAAPKAPRASTTTKSTEVENPVQVWAIIVGVAAYGNMPALSFTDDDAYRMYSFLRSPEGGAVHEDQIRILIDEGATRKLIISAMEKTYMRADTNDVIVFYFSGHGLKNAFLPIDFDGHLNTLKHSEIKDIFAKSPAKYKLCIADACHAGGMVTDKMPDNSYYEAFGNAKGGTAFMLSSKEEEYSIENIGLRQGIFTHFLIKGMKGTADKDRDGIVTIKEVYDYVQQNVRKYTQNNQNPILYGDYDDKMPVGFKRMMSGQAIDENY